MDLDFVSVHKNAKKELGQYPAILTSRLVNNAYLLTLRRRGLSQAKARLNVLVNMLVSEYDSGFGVHSVKLAPSCAKGRHGTETRTLYIGANKED